MTYANSKREEGAKVRNTVAFLSVQRDSQE